VGVTANIPASYRCIEWFGLGPGESYPDRLGGVFLGVWQHTPEELETPYIVPQENGNRSGVRRIVLRGPGDGALPPEITILPCRPVNMSVSRYTPDNMLRALHTHELADTMKTDGYYTLNIDAAQRGVGTATCGPDTLEAYRLRGGVYRLTLLFA
jgi:beta-galactosidase